MAEGVDSLVVDPVGEFVGVESNELADLEEGDAAFGDESSDEPWGYVQYVRCSVDVQQS